MHRHTIWVFVSSSSSGSCSCMLFAFFESLPNTLDSNSTKCNFEFGAISIMPYFSFTKPYCNFELCQSVEKKQSQARTFVTSFNRSIVHSFIHSSIHLTVLLTFNLSTVKIHIFQNVNCLFDFHFFLSLLLLSFEIRVYFMKCSRVCVRVCVYVKNTHNLFAFGR